MADLDLFAYAARYPDAPGYRNESTSKEAAAAIAPKQGTLQAKVLEYLRTLAPSTSEEIAEGVRESYDNIQPRTAELSRPTKSRPALIEDSGLRRPRKSTGKPAIVWRARG